MTAPAHALALALVSPLAFVLAPASGIAASGLAAPDMDAPGMAASDL